MPYYMTFQLYALIWFFSAAPLTLNLGIKPLTNMFKTVCYIIIIVSISWDQKQLWSDYCALKKPPDQTIVRSKSPLIRLLCAQKASWSDYCALKKPPDQTIVRSKSPLIRLLCAQKAPWSDYCALKKPPEQTIVRSKSPLSRLFPVFQWKLFLRAIFFHNFRLKYFFQNSRKWFFVIISCFYEVIFGRDSFFGISI